MKNWTDVFSMGVQDLDQDHKRLLRVAEMIAERVDNPETDPKQWPFLVREGMKYMEGYYLTHIGREEAYMRMKGYSHYESHKLVHEELDRMVSGYISTQITEESCNLDDVLKLLGATYGWQMIHIAMDDMAIIGKGAMARSEVTELNEDNVIREIDAMMEDLLGIDAQTKVLDSHYKVDSMNSVVCQRITYNIAGTDVTLVVGMEKTILQHATEFFWGAKVEQKKIDRAHMMLLQWCLSSFIIGFWRDMIVRFTHDKPCVLKDTSPLDIQDTRQMVRTVSPRRSTLYGTTKGRFFVVCDH